MQVHDRDDCFCVIFYDEEHTKRKAMQDGSSAFVKHARILLRTLLNSFERGAKFSQELRPEPLAFAVVPYRAASSASSSASGRTFSPAIYRPARRRC